MCKSSKRKEQKVHSKPQGRNTAAALLGLFALSLTNTLRALEQVGGPQLSFTGFSFTGVWMRVIQKYFSGKKPSCCKRLPNAKPRHSLNLEACSLLSITAQRTTSDSSPCPSRPSLVLTTTVIHQTNSVAAGCATDPTR